MRIAIADDLSSDRETLLAGIRRWAEEHRVSLTPAPALFDSGEALLDHMKDTSYDVIFLDIYMTGITGMDTARHIRETNRECRLIFTSSSAEFAAESYDVDSTYYLVKPYSYEKLARALDRCGTFASVQEQTVTIPGRSGEERLALHSIVYTEYANRRVTVHMKDGTAATVTVRQGDFAETLLQYPFFCDCMKGILVNLEMVEDLQKDRFLLKNGRYIPISRLKYQNVREQFLQYSYAKVRKEGFYAGNSV